MNLLRKCERSGCSCVCVCISHGHRYVRARHVKRQSLCMQRNVCSTTSTTRFFPRLISRRKNSGCQEARGHRQHAVTIIVIKAFTRNAAYGLRKVQVDVHLSMGVAIHFWWSSPLLLGGIRLPFWVVFGWYSRGIRWYSPWRGLLALCAWISLENIFSANHVRFLALICNSEFCLHIKGLAQKVVFNVPGNP